MSNMSALFDSAVKAVKNIDPKKIKNSIDAIGIGVEIAQSVLEKPEVALAGLLKTFAKRAMGTTLSDAGSKDLAVLVVKAIRKAER